MDVIALWEDTLRRLFNLPACIIIVTGEWKTGKTDVSLFLYEELKRLGIIEKGATNIFTFDSEVEYLFSMQSVKAWMFKDFVGKSYIYDESISNTPSRQAMARLNVEWLKTIPELSKGNVKLIVVSQEIDLGDSIFYNPTFLRGIIRKVSKSHCEIMSRLIPEKREFYDIPRTSIKFDPYRLAPFEVKDRKTMEDLSLNENVPICCKVGRLVSEGKSFSEVGKILNPQKPIHRFQVQRYLRYHLKHTLLGSGADSTSKELSQ